MKCWERKEVEKQRFDFCPWDGKPALFMRCWQTRGKTKLDSQETNNLKLAQSQGRTSQEACRTRGKKNNWGKKIHFRAKWESCVRARAKGNPVLTQSIHLGGQTKRERVKKSVGKIRSPLWKRKTASLSFFPLLPPKKVSVHHQVLKRGFVNGNFLQCPTRQAATSKICLTCGVWHIHEQIRSSFGTSR